MLMRALRFTFEQPDPILTGPRLEGLWYQECKKGGKRRPEGGAGK